MNRSSLGSSSPQRGAAPQPPYPGSCLPPRAVAPDTPPPPPDEKCGGRLEGLLAQADEILLKAEYDTYTPDRLSTRTETDGGIGPGSRPRMEDGSAGPKPRTEDGSPTMSERLLSLYAIEAGKETRSSHLKLASNLLDRLMTTSPFSRLVLTLNQQDGYVLGLMSSSLVYSELVKFSYQDTHLLNSIDNEEIPVIIADLLQDLSQNLFHGGCIVCEVRDHRGGGGGPWGGSRFVLLRPTTQSIICDSVRLGKEGLGRVNSEDRNSIESQIIPKIVMLNV
ncbi:transcription factor SPT20 homolog [Eurytemora carolleeae]|uniref:transcription factor SPT20 homolog n=1 Tax=Eurytemora carolleeae TaxID=1294199 RepID=UPI000C7669F7|nr:transcription factor SPT20 homolog [Eurytemora carolleeae]|eukprot:XP_023319776.1 transcription factor SPT20 homolog [Eurytemora affinis]